MTVRAARPEDLDAVLELWRGARSAHAVTEDSPARVAGLIASESLLVADDAGEILGALIAAFDGWRGNMYRLAVVPSHRRRGIARLLVSEGEKRLRARGAPRVTALVAFDDDAARGFWEAVGYGADAEIGRMVRSL